MYFLRSYEIIMCRPPLDMNMIIVGILGSRSRRNLITVTAAAVVSVDSDWLISSFE